MSASTKRCSIVSLKMGKKIFPVKKRLLLKNSHLLRHDRSLLENDEYKVQSRVRRSVFAAFVGMIEGSPITISEENCEAFQLLADEFRFEALSTKCAEFVTATRRRLPGRHWILEPCGRNVQVRQGLFVTVTVGDRYRVFGTLKSADDVLHFTKSLAEADEEGIRIDGMKGTDRIVERAVAAVYSNTLARFPADTNKPFLALLLRELQHRLCELSIDAEIYCLNRLNDIAPTGFDKARLLLLSQCRMDSSGGLMMLPTAELCIIYDALVMLKREKNGKAEEAKDLLSKFKGIEEFNARFGSLDDLDGSDYSDG
jgi:hypothetical protein